MLNKYTKQEIVRHFKAVNDGTVRIYEMADGFEFCGGNGCSQVIHLKVYDDLYYLTEFREDANVVLGKFSIDDFSHDLDTIMRDIISFLRPLAQSH